jgi:hypothetical protein
MIVRQSECEYISTLSQRSFSHPHLRTSHSDSGTHKPSPRTFESFISAAMAVLGVGLSLERLVDTR